MTTTIDTAVADMKRKAIDFRNQTVDMDHELNLPDRWKRNAELFNGNHTHGGDIADGITPLSLNRVQGSVRTMVMAMMADEPTVRFIPQETGDLRFYFVTKTGRDKVAMATGEGQQPPPWVNGSEDDLIDELTYMAQVKPFEMRQVQDEQGNVSVEGILEPGRDIFVADDANAAMFFESLYRYLYRKARGRFENVRLAFNAGIYGTGFRSVWWDTDSGSIKVENHIPQNVYVDPDAEGYKDAAFVIMDKVVTRDEAVSMFTSEEQVEIIDRNAKSLDGSNVPMVRLSYAWRRFFEFDIDEDKALRLRLVAPFPRQEFEAPEPVFDPASGEDVVAQPEPTEPEVEPEFEYVLTDDYGDPTDVGTNVGDENWPKEEGVYETILVGSYDDEEINGAEVLKEGRCPYADIPLVWMTWIYDPTNVYGVGEPHRTDDIQRALNLQFSVFMNSIQNRQCPTMLVNDNLKDIAGPEDLFKTPNKVHYTPSEIMMEIGRLGGDMVTQIVPPELSPTQIAIFDRNDAEFETVSMQTNVLRGESDPNARSGVAIQELKSSARGPIGAAAMSMEEMLGYEADLITGMIEDFMRPRDIARITSRPMGFIMEMLRRRTGAKFDTQVVMVPGPMSAPATSST